LQDSTIMPDSDPPDGKLRCSQCHRDIFAIRQENGLEVKYNNRWMMILNDTAGTILFRCRFCKSVTAYHLNNSTVTETHVPT